MGSPEHRIPYAAIALLEGNVIGSRGTSVAGLAFITALSGAMTVFCATNPKACFGSCPTFSAWNGTSMELQAEGFSSSITPALEATDVDALFRARPAGDFFTVHVRNEALETQTIRRTELLVFPRPVNGRVFKTPSGEFREATTLRPPRSARAGSRDILAPLFHADGIEYFSPADSTDLARRETIELEFECTAGEPIGLVVMSRQTLMTTFLMYQTLAYFGNGVGAMLAEIERGGNPAIERLKGAGELLGTIEVMVPLEGGTWTVAGRTGETGPIASDVTVVPLGRGSSRGVVPVRLCLTRGFWRLDWVALMHLGRSVPPARLTPVTITSLGNDELPVGTEWPGAQGPLVLLPGDAYSVTYRLPRELDDPEFFMESRGYYLEWIRKSWIEEENPERALVFLTEPAEYLRLLAPEYKKVEASMDEQFWSSRYAKLP